jgi:adenylate cyclase
MDIDELVRRGLYEPDADDAGDQLDLVRYLLGAGVPQERLAGVRGAAALRDALAEYRLLGNEPRRSPRQVAHELGASIELVTEVLASAGLPMPDPDAAVMTQPERQALAAFFAATQLFGEQELLRFTRVLAGALGRITEAAVSMFSVNIEDPLVAGGGSQVDLTRAVDDALITLGVVPELFSALFRRHALNAMRRLAAAHVGLSGHDQVAMTVGFADLVGSTAWTREQAPRELAAALGEFERLAHRSLRGEARLVKTIGDEVMFVTLDAAAGCRTALTLAGAVHAEPNLPELRVGLAAGLVAAHDGDFYGDEVNRAARLVHAGEAGEVVVSAAVARLAASEPDLRFVPLGTRSLAGFDEQVETAAVHWVDPPSGRSRARDCGAV